MKNQPRKIIFTASLVIFVVLGFASPVFAQDASVSLFAADQRSDFHEVTEGLPPYMTRSRQVSINPAAVSAFEENRGTLSALTLNLFEDVIFQAQVVETEITPTDGLLIKGTIAGSAYSEVTLVLQDGLLSGGIAYNDQYFKIDVDENGAQVVVEIDQTGFPQDLAPVEPEIELPVMEDQRSVEAGIQDSPDQIDVMVVYTAQARANAGGTAAIQNTINLAISETNTGYINSQVNQRFVLVHTQEFNYPESDFYTMLVDLRDADGDALDPVHALRDSYSADLVVMLVDNVQYCGLAYVMTTPNVSFAPYAFSVVSRICATGYYSFAHETGHNMGSQHNRENASQPGAYDFSYGLYNTALDFRTIMAYNCPGGCIRVNHWSNPYVTYQGAPTGIINGAPNAAYNALSLDQTAPYVANFRIRPFDVPLDYSVFLPVINK